MTPSSLASSQLASSGFRSDRPPATLPTSSTATAETTSSPAAAGMTPSTAASETTASTAAPETTSLNGDDGNDVIVGGGGADVVNGGNGNDTLTGGSGVGASVFGGAGNDLIFQVNGTPEFINGGTGIDTLNTTAFNGNYVVNLTTGVTNFAGECFINMENLIAGAGNDTLTGTAGRERHRRRRRQRRDFRPRRQRSPAGLATTPIGRDQRLLLAASATTSCAAGARNDRLIGGPGIDTLDRRDWATTSSPSSPSTTRSPAAATRSSRGTAPWPSRAPGITFFGAPNDRIDLSAIDAITAAADQRHLRLRRCRRRARVTLVNEAFTGNTLVRASVDGDAGVRAGDRHRRWLWRRRRRLLGRRLRPVKRRGRRLLPPARNHPIQISAERHRSGSGGHRPLAAPRVEREAAGAEGGEQRGSRRRWRGSSGS